MTDEGFDPYREWLGLKSPPANDYELLGLPVDETDAARIAGAAARAIARLRSVRPGRRQAIWKELLDELEAARRSLLGGGQAPSPVDPMAPVEFPTAPRGRSSLAAHLPSAGQSPSTSASGLDLLPVRVRPSGRPQRLTRSARRSLTRAPRGIRPSTAYGLLGLCFAMVLAAFVSVIYWRIVPAREVRQQYLAAIPQSAADLPLPLEVEPASGRADAIQPVEPPVELQVEPPLLETPPSAAVSAHPEEPAGKAELSVASPDRVRDVEQKLRRVYEALCERRWADAERLIGEAQSLAESTTEQPRVERFAILADYAHQYHQASIDGMQNLAGSELVVGENRVYVVEVTGERIVIRADGRNRRFALERLPTQLLMAVADRWFDQRATTTGVFRGAYMLVTPPVAVDEVWAVWQTAEQSGVSLDDLPQIIEEVRTFRAE